MLFQMDYIAPEQGPLDAPVVDPVENSVLKVEGPPGNFCNGLVISVMAQDHGPGQTPVKVLGIFVDESLSNGRLLKKQLVQGKDVAIKVLR